MEFDFCDGGDDVKHSGVGLVAIPEIFAVNDNFYDGVVPFNTVECSSMTVHLCKGRKLWQAKLPRRYLD